MANLRIVPLNHWDAATLSTSVAPATGFPIINTQNTTRNLTCRTTSNAAQNWLGTWSAGVSRTATFLGIFLHNAVASLASAATIRAQFYSDAAWTTQIYDTTALSANNITTPTDVFDFGIGSNDPFLGTWPYWIWFAETTAFRSVKISFASIPGTYFEASRIVIGKHLEVTYNPAYGDTLKWLDNSTAGRSRGGSLRRNRGATWRVMDNALPWIPEAQRAAWLDIQRMCGTSVDFVHSLYPTDGTRLERDYMMNACFESLDGLNRPSKNRLSTRLQIVEV